MHNLALAPSFTIISCFLYVCIGCYSKWWNILWYVSEHFAVYKNACKNKYLVAISAWFKTQHFNENHISFLNAFFQPTQLCSYFYEIWCELSSYFNWMKNTKEKIHLKYIIFHIPPLQLLGPLRAMWAWNQPRLTWGPAQIWHVPK